MNSSLFGAEAAARAKPWTLPDFAASSAAPPPPTAAHLDEVEKAAYEDGFARGRADGEAQGYADGARIIREQADRLRTLFDHFARPLNELGPEVERMLVALALDVGRRLAHGAIKEEPERIAAIVQEALGALAQPVREARIHVNPEDAKLLDGSLNPPPDCAWRVVPDRELMRGDCRVVTDTAQVDARLDTREASIARAVFGEQR